MTVSELRKCLLNLSETLATAGAGPAAAEVKNLCTKLVPFATEGLKEFGELLDVAKEVRREGGPKKRRGKAAKDPGQAARAAERVRQLYDESLTPSFNPEAMSAEVDQLAKLTGDELKAVAAAVGIVKKMNKGPLLSAIKQAILDRRGSWDRAQT